MKQGCHYRTDTRGIAVNKQALSLAVFIAGAYPAASNALGLGDIESSSHLNQPLRAKIELLASAPADASQIQVRLASPEVFNRVGVARPDFLSKLNFTPTVQSGKPVILVTSDTPIQEPFVNFLLEVSWPQGQLLKEYTVMLDPPVMLQPGNTVAGGEAAVRAEPKAAGSVRRPQPAQPAAEQDTGSDAATAPEQAPAPVAASNRTYRVKTGDTLFRVASRLQRQGVSNEQMMIALFRANPGAFINNNLNNLRTGATLKAPSSRDVGSVSRAQAKRQIRQQNAEWREFRQSLAKNTVPQQQAASNNAPNTGQNKPSTPADNNTASTKPTDKRLEVLGAKDGQSTPKNAAVAAGGNASVKLSELEKQLSLARESLSARQKENDELKSRVTDLESMLDKKNRLIELRNEQLSNLQKQLSDNGIKSTPANANPNAKPNEQPQNQANKAGAVTDTPTDASKDLQTHIANMAGKDGNTVLRSEPPAANNANPLIASTPSTANAKPPVPPASNNATPATPTPAPNTPNANPATPTPPVGATPTPPSANNPVAGTQPALTPPPTTPPVPADKPAALEPPPAVAQTPTVVPVTPVTVDTAKANNKPKTPPPVFADQQDDDLLSLLTSPLALQIGAGSLALLLLLWLLSRRRKAGDDGSSGSAKSNKKTKNKGNIDPPLDNVLSDDEFSLLDANSKAEAHHGLDDFSSAGSTAWGTNEASESTTNKVTQDTFTGEQAHVETHEEDDLLTEANVYIAYGLYQQAESELKKGIERHPEKLEYRHKLLECYFVANNREAFDRQAEQFVALNGKGKETLWKSIVEWGRKISPDNALYQTGISTSNVATGAVAAVGAAAAAAVASAAFASEPDEPAPVAASTPELHLDDLNPALDLDHELDAGLDLDFDLPEQKPVQPVMDSFTPPTDTALEDLGELDLGELDFDDIDLDKLLQGDERSTAPQAVAAPVVAETKPEMPAQETGSDFDLDFDLDLNDGLDFTAEPNHIETAPVAEVEDDDNLLDFMTEGVEEFKPANNITEIKPAQAAASVPATNLNLHLDNANVNRILPKDTFYAPPVAAENPDQDWLGDIDDALSFLDFPDEEIDLHEAHISTKLDLARAYLDMGDIEGARSTLEEVMVEGNDDQRREAEVLLHQTG